MTVEGAGPAAAGMRPAETAGGANHERLRRATKQFEAVFIQEMLKAMRETVPEGGLLDAGRSEEMFTALLDQHVADTAADRAEGSLADALYRQFAGRVDG